MLFRRTNITCFITFLKLEIMQGNRLAGRKAMPDTV